MLHWHWRHVSYFYVLLSCSIPLELDQGYIPIHYDGFHRRSMLGRSAALLGCVVVVASRMGMSLRIVTADIFE